MGATKQECAIRLYSRLKLKADQRASRISLGSIQASGYMIRYNFHNKWSTKLRAFQF